MEKMSEKVVSLIPIKGKPLAITFALEANALKDEMSERSTQDTKAKEVWLKAEGEGWPECLWDEHMNGKVDKGNGILPEQSKSDKKRKRRSEHTPYPMILHNAKKWQKKFKKKNW